MVPHCYDLKLKGLVRCEDVTDRKAEQDEELHWRQESEVIFLADELA